MERGARLGEAGDQQSGRVVGWRAEKGHRWVLPELGYTRWQRHGAGEYKMADRFVVTRWRPPELTSAAWSLKRRVKCRNTQPDIYTPKSKIQAWRNNPLPNSHSTERKQIQNHNPENPQSKGPLPKDRGQRQVLEILEFLNQKSNLAMKPQGQIQPRDQEHGWSFGQWWQTSEEEPLEDRQEVCIGGGIPQDNGPEAGSDSREHTGASLKVGLGMVTTEPLWGLGWRSGCRPIVAAEPLRGPGKGQMTETSQAAVCKGAVENLDLNEPWYIKKTLGK